MVQLPVPVQAPLQPEKVEPLAAVAVKARVAPPVKVALQTLPQLIPLGLVTTVPFPVPAFVTASVRMTVTGAIAQASLEYAESPTVL
jgi:hypothetical protein